jgi:hypothetical protein
MRDWLEHRPVSFGTRRRYRAMIDTVKYWLNERGRADISIGSVNYNLMADHFRTRATRLIISHAERAFLRKLLESGASKATLNCERSFLRSIFLEAVRRGYLDKNPLNGISCPAPRLQEWAINRRPRRAWERILWFSLSRQPKCLPKACGKPSRRIGLDKASVGRGLRQWGQGFGEMKAGVARCTDVITVPVALAKGSRGHPAAYPAELTQHIILTSTEAVATRWGYVARLRYGSRYGWAANCVKTRGIQGSSEA